MPTHNITLDVHKRTSQIPPQVVCRRGEANSETIVATILNDGVAYTSKCSNVRLDILHADNTWARVSATKSGNEVTCTLPSDALNSHGLCKLAHFVFYTSTTTVETTQGFELRILPAVETTDAESMAENYEDILTELYEKWKEYEEQAEKSEKSRVSAENSRTVAENARSAAETSRINAENERATAENSRVNAEGTREAEFSTIKANAEDAIANANTATANANTATAKAITATTNANNATIAANAAANKANEAAENAGSSAESTPYVILSSSQFRKQSFTITSSALPKALTFLEFFYEDTYGSKLMFSERFYLDDSMYIPLRGQSASATTYEVLNLCHDEYALDVTATQNSAKTSITYKITGTLKYSYRITFTIDNPVTGVIKNSSTSPFFAITKIVGWY